jgi:hypothetical protein
MLTFLVLIITILSILIVEMKDIEEFSLILAVMSLVLWISIGIAAISITSTTTTYDGSAIVDHVYTYPDTWIISFVYCMISIFPFLLIIKRVPESWNEKKTE